MGHFSSMKSKSTASAKSTTRTRRHYKRIEVQHITLHYIQERLQQNIRNCSRAITLKHNASQRSVCSTAKGTAVESQLPSHYILVMTHPCTPTVLDLPRMCLSSRVPENLSLARHGARMMLCRFLPSINTRHNRSTMQVGGCW